MKNAILAAVMSAVLLLTGGCTFQMPNLPVDVAVRYEIEAGIWLVVQPADKGGYEIDFDGTGPVNDWLTVVEGGIELHSPLSGLTYFIEPPGPAGGKPRVTVIAAAGDRIEDPLPVDLKPAGPAIAVPALEGGEK